MNNDNTDRLQHKLLAPPFLWGYILAIPTVIAILADLRGGYVGGDYNLHLAKMLTAEKIWDFSWVHPPTYYFLAHSLYLLIGKNNGFPITLSVLQVLVNAYALWWFYLYTQPLFRSKLMHLSLVIFLAFLPVRVLHTASVATDWTTIPIFVLLLFIFERFRGNRTPSLIDALYFGLALGLGVFTKYTFISLVPAFFVFFAYLARKNSWGIKLFAAICLLTLALPTGLFIFSSVAMTASGGEATRVFLPKGGAPGQPDMDYYDLFSLKAADFELFEAPEEFTRDPSETQKIHIGFRARHKHSYLALAHLSTFTDTMNLFQNLPVPQSLDTFLIPDYKTRDPWKTPVMQLSSILGVFWTLAALIGTAWLVIGGIWRLFRGRAVREDFVVLLGMAYFGLLFLPIPYVYYGALNGYWMARLILVPLLTFFLAGLLLIDKKLAAKYTSIGYMIFGLAIVQASVEAVMMS